MYVFFSYIIGTDGIKLCGSFGNVSLDFTTKYGMRKEKNSFTRIYSVVPSEQLKQRRVKHY